MLWASYVEPRQARRCSKEKVVQKSVFVVGDLWMKMSGSRILMDIHKTHRIAQLLKTLSSELKSRVNSLLVDLSIAILRQACRTVV